MDKRHFLIFLVFFVFSKIIAQKSNYQFVAIEYNFGKTAVANVDFPPLHPHHAVAFSWGQTHNETTKYWTRHLNFPETGVTLSFADMGNPSHLGYAISLVPFANFKVFQRWSNRFDIKVGLGASYFTTHYDAVTNPNNKAISTAMTWAFRSNLYYKIWEKPNNSFRLGLGYFHNSNGHTRLPNNGLNTFLVSLYSQFNGKSKAVSPAIERTTITETKTKQIFYEARFGLGEKVLSKYDATKKDVYTYAVSRGVIWNKTFKLGYGAYYRIYKDYHDYIKEGGSVVVALYPEYQKHPTRYASNFGVMGSAEMVMGHLGINLEMGINFYKPAYAFDWQINEEYYKDGAMHLGELTSYYQLKKVISSRLGAKWYLISNEKSPRHNLFLGAFINANLGQADFSELTIGYQYALPLQSKPRT